MCFGRACFHTLPGKRKEVTCGEVLASRHVRGALEAAVSLQHNPASEIIDFNYLLFRRWGMSSDITSLYSSHLLTFHLFLFIAALPLASRILFLRKSKPHPRFGITSTHLLTLQIFTTQTTLHSLKTFAMRSLIPFFVLILLGAKAHPHVSNPHQVLVPNQHNVDIDDTLNEGAGFQRPVHTTELMALATAGAGRDGPA
ncbi:hypothetical protein BGZ57DRAFT_404408 [Hyaloscypha finlandica]|nr:hypothetical protein BGZ57DRAFT_404408 [Hyaloscypha finlandica]